MCYKSPGPRCSAHVAQALTRIKWEQRNFFKSGSGKYESYEALKEAEQKAQDDYDATPAGILELQRRTKGKRPSPREVDRLALGILRRKEALAKIGMKDQGDYGTHDDRLQEDKHERVIQREFQDGTVTRAPVPHDAEHVVEALVQGSAAWIKKLSPEEIEAVSWMTSNGFAVMRTHADGREHPTWGHDVYSPEMLDENIKHVISAITKAPRLKEPVVIYRGIKEVHIVDDAEKDSVTSGFKEIDTQVVKDRFPVGSTVNLGPLPASATLNPQTALKFSSDVVLEIKTRTFASPVNVSAWSTTEYETFVDPTRKYRVVAVHDDVTYDAGSSRETGIRVVQLEEIEE